MKNTPPNYLLLLIKKYPEILSGRKNFIKHHQRIKKAINLTKKYFKKQNKY